MGSHYELPEARILADVREENPYIEDQMFDTCEFVFIDSFDAYGATKFLIRNLDEVDAELLWYALQGHPDRNHHRIYKAKKTNTESRNFIVELNVKQESKKLPLDLIKECFHDLTQLFQHLRTLIVH